MREDNASNAIIRLPCIEEDTRFKYKRCLEIRGGAETDIRVQGEEQLNEHEVESTHDTGA